MKTSGFGLSALFVAVGAVLAWAVDYEAEGVDLNQVGLIVFFVGLALALITLVVTLAGGHKTVDSTTEAVVDGDRVVEERRQVVTER